jgi:hypothetical protein
MRNRYYNPRIMRFCNADPIGFGGGPNWYAYAGNNPVSNTDPSGLTIEYANHPVVWPFYHSLIAIIPDNQALYANDPRFNNVNGQGLHFATIGAGPVDGMLAAVVDRANDVSQAFQNIQVLPLPDQYANEDDAIATLFALVDTYNKYPERYTLFPKAWTGEYNSNSFISGLIGAAGYKWFPNTGANTPGWYPNWVPDRNFGVGPYWPTPQGTVEIGQPVVKGWWYSDTDSGSSTTSLK